MSQVSLGRKWEAIGPFPSGMREHPFMGSSIAAFPLVNGHSDTDIDFALRPFMIDDVWPSELPDGGVATWSVFEVDEEGWVEIVYPNVRWDQLRSDHGWAALQFQSVLRNNFKIPSTQGSETTRIRIDVIQGIEYALVRIPNLKDSSQDPLSGPVTWYAADIYAFAETKTGRQGIDPETTENEFEKGAATSAMSFSSVSNFARTLDVIPGEYVILVRAAYEIRMFGDPGLGHSPTIRLKVSIDLDKTSDKGGRDVLVQEVMGLDTIPDLVDGWMMGEWLSIGIRAGQNDVNVQVVGDGDKQVIDGVNSSLEVLPGLRTRLVKGQTRVIPVRLKQKRAVDIESIVVRIVVSSGDRNELLLVRRKIFKRSIIGGSGSTMTSMNRPTFKVTFPSPGLSIESEKQGQSPACISHAIIVAPAKSSEDEVEPNPLLPPVILSLHGAGVDIGNPAWAEAIPAFPGSGGGGWAVLPTGRNEWGEDWHGGSMTDAWAARDAVGWAVNQLSKGGIGGVEERMMEVSNETLIIGHSNGGQGAWHLAARWPDRIVGLVVASGYLNIQHYVPYIEQVSKHFADPALLGILSASLTPYDNDLYASNLASVPVLAIHGGDDTNVPPRHGRAHTGLVGSWTGKATKGISMTFTRATAGWSGWSGSGDVTFVEIQGKEHWWNEVFKEDVVKDWLSRLPRMRKGIDEVRKNGFTLTTANPDESGGKAGIRIAELDTPGRLARLDVNARQWRHGNERPGGLDLHGMNIRRIEVTTIGEQPEIQNLFNVKGEFRPAPIHVSRAYGPLIRILSSASPIHFIAPTSSSRLSQIAARLAHDIWTYHRTDCIILDDADGLRAVADGRLGKGVNVVVLGRPEENRFSDWLISRQEIPVAFPTKGVMTVNGAVIYEEGTGIITLHPHPTDPKALAMLIAGNDKEGLELATRVFPLRTGVPVPDWAVVSARCKWQAAGGLIGAGFWDADWNWNGKMSWMDRS